MGLSAFFDSRFKFRVHIVQLSLITLVVILSIARIAMGSPQRAHTMGIAIGLKSIAFILYQVLTEHTEKFQKWASKKTNLILNCVEIPFWGVLMVMLLSVNVQVCVGGSCAVSWIIALLSIVLL
ncbi:hypothetical protein F4776DRAFT_663065 [Hypoxylon sp. NC0597]|nr:hypothetical protein F4776DRAFT_663065 [Hypoxylon sp. NC0597]